MANTFIAKKADMINLDVASKAQLNRLEDFTKVICDKATSVKDTIEAIETENNGLPISKRKTYFVYLNSSSNPIHVVKTVFKDSLCIFTSLLNSGTVNLSYSGSNNYGKPHNDAAVQGYITVAAPLTSVVAVAFGSYNPDVIDGFNTLDADKEILIKKLRKEIEKLNSLKASGMTRSYIIEFSRFMKEDSTNKINNYKYNIEAYNLYTTMWSTYLLDIEQIINNIKETAKGIANFKYDIFTENDGEEQLPLYYDLIK